MKMLFQVWHRHEVPGADHHRLPLLKTHSSLGKFSEYFRGGGTIFLEVILTYIRTDRCLFPFLRLGIGVFYCFILRSMHSFIVNPRGKIINYLHK